MKYFCLSVCVLILFIHAQAQFVVHAIKLPPDVEYYDNQYSSLYIAHDKLYLMSECRLEDKAPAFLTSVYLSDLDKAIRDSTYQPHFTKIPIYGLDILRNKMTAQNQSYEGLEATVIKNNTVYFSVETATPSDDCYLVKGYFSGDAIFMDTSKLLQLPKPVDTSGQHIYNAGFESLEMIEDKLYAFYEYNYFSPGKNFVSGIDTSLNENAVQKIALKNKMPFRITDVTKANNRGTLIGINYFYKGEGKDEVYRVPQSDTANYPLTQDASGVRSYCRLVKLDFHNNEFSWKPYAPLPSAYWAYNWEGLAIYRNGFFITNDKYTPSRPYKTNLLYMEPGQ